MNRILQQEQQGFFPSVAVIDCQPCEIDPDRPQKPFDYQPRVLARAGIENKLPMEINEPVEDIPVVERQYERVEDEERQRVEALSVWEKYVKRKDYRLVYSKDGGNPFKQSGDDFTKREINLSSVWKYNPSNYTALKQIKLSQLNKSFANDDLIFDSRFECGNLRCVYASLKQSNTFDCFIQSDTNSSGYNQWLYFSLQNIKKNVTYRFNIVNMTKKFSFLKLGMKPTLFSAERHKKEGNGWYRRGYNIRYQASDIYYMKGGEKIRPYSASFDMNFDYDMDFVTVSLGVPYSYSRLIRQLNAFKMQAESNDVSWHQETLCHSISCNQVPYLTISKSQPSETQEKKEDKKVIVLFARQHPGQMNSSFIMEKILGLLSRNANSKIDWLLSKYQFRIFPMVNVDGVIYGNFRCDLIGFDLNRCWKTPISELHPQVSAIKKQIQSLSKKYKIACCMDLHSHSKQLNVFSYCNKSDQVESRLLSFILSKNCSFFHFPSCTFGLSREKESTARAVIGSFVINENSLTIECSSFGYRSQDKIVALSSKSFEQISLAILSSLKSFLSNNKQRKVCLTEIQQNIYKLRSYCRRSWEIQSGSQSDHIAEFAELQSKLRSILPIQMILNIKKNLRQLEVLVSDRPSRQVQTPREKQQVADSVRIITKVPVRKVQIISQIREPPRKPTEILLKRNQQKLETLTPPSIVWRSNRNNPRVKTEPKYQEALAQPLKSQKSVRYSTPNKVIYSNKNEFKHSMKVLYKELTTAQDDMQGSVLINKEKSIERHRTESQGNRLQKILKVRRKPNQFRSILCRYELQEDPLLKIRSEYSNSTLQAINPSISPVKNYQIDKLLIPKEEFPKNNYVSHLSFLNKFLKSNIRETLKSQK